MDRDPLPVGIAPGAQIVIERAEVRVDLEDRTAALALLERHQGGGEPIALLYPRPVVIDAQLGGAVIA
jgi:hypothetical protein